MTDPDQRRYAIPDWAVRAVKIERTVTAISFILILVAMILPTATIGSSWVWLNMIGVWVLVVAWTVWHTRHILKTGITRIGWPIVTSYEGLPAEQGSEEWDRWLTEPRQELVRTLRLCGTGVVFFIIAIGLVMALVSGI